MATADKRPLSPHLQVYRPQISSMVSIAHRIAGIALTFGAALFALWLWGAAYDISFFDCISEQLRSWYGQLFLVGWTFAFYLHLANGIRHLIWDMGHGYTIPVMNKSGWFVILFTFAATAGTWYCLYTRIAA